MSILEGSHSDAMFGQQTELSIRYFGNHGRTIGDVPELIGYLAKIKRAAAAVNLRLGVLDSVRGNAIIRACREIEEGVHRDQFPTALVLGGGGTTTNMNVNEVVAFRASRISSVVVHPNDHVNASQSTNDVLPTAFALTVADRSRRPQTSLQLLATALDAKADEFAGIRYLGRTCLRDAVSSDAGASLRGQASAVRRGAREISEAIAGLSEVPLGGTVLGTGIGAPPDFARLVVEELAQDVIIPIRAAANRYDVMSFQIGRAHV